MCIHVGSIAALVPGAVLVVVIKDTKASFSYTDLVRCLPGVQFTCSSTSGRRWKVVSAHRRCSLHTDTLIETYGVYDILVYIVQ